MKIIRNTNTKKATLSLNKSDWIRLGQKAGWEIPEEALQNNEPVSEPFNIEVKKYGNRSWAVYLNGELLCVTVYKKGAFAVESKLVELSEQILSAEGRIRMVG